MFFLLYAFIIYGIYQLVKYFLKRFYNRIDSKPASCCIADSKAARKAAGKKAAILIDQVKIRLDKNECIRGFRIHMEYDETIIQLAAKMEIPPYFSTITDCTIKYTGGTRKTLIPGSIPLTGDPDFDLRLIIGGLNAIQLLSIFDQPARIILKQLVRDTGKFSFIPPHIEFFIPIISAGTNNTLLLAVIDTFIELLKKLLPAGDVKKRLLSNCMKDPYPGVRLNNLKALYQTYAMDNDVRNMLLTALFDPGKEVGEFALKCLGEEGIQTIKEFIIDNPLVNFNPSGVINALELLADTKGEECSLVLIDYFHKSDSLKIKKSIIRILTKIKGFKAEKFLIKMLHTGINPFIEDAIFSLAGCGTERAVMPLLDFAKKLFIPYDLKGKARNAVARIQSRLGPAEKGMLSLSETEELDGALSFFEDEKIE